MPIAPLLAMSAILFLGVSAAAWRKREGSQRHRGGGLAFAVLGPAVLIQAISAAAVYAAGYQPVAYVVANGTPVWYKLFFYDSVREFDHAIDYIRAHAAHSDVVAAGTPHWCTCARTWAVMPPFVKDVSMAQALLDTVPVRY